MNALVRAHLRQIKKHLYISPLELCNLGCRMCYTPKTTASLSENDIMNFVRAYQKHQTLETVTLCGGEVFTLPYLVSLVNRLTKSGILVQIITNGTVDRLTGFQRPNSINLIVSLDGLPKYHDANRGEGNFKKSLSFLKKAQRLGFHTEIFSIVTGQNYKHIAAFEQYIKTQCANVVITYHPRKPLSYLRNHPKTTLPTNTKGFDFLAAGEMRNLIDTKKTFPPRSLGCYQIALMSDGNVYGCCEGVRPIGTMKDDVGTLFDALEKRLIQWEEKNKGKLCLGCSEPDFVCGMKKHIQ